MKPSNQPSLTSQILLNLAERFSEANSEPVGYNLPKQLILDVHDIPENDVDTLVSIYVSKEADGRFFVKVQDFVLAQDEDGCTHGYTSVEYDLFVDDRAQITGDLFDSAINFRCEFTAEDITTVEKRIQYALDYPERLLRLNAGTPDLAMPTSILKTDFL